MAPIGVGHEVEVVGVGRGENRVQSRETRGSYGPRGKARMGVGVVRVVGHGIHGRVEEPGPGSPKSVENGGVRL